ncbi:MAG: class I SAM-dependent methyltransferase [Oscillospiraceae bacterium]|nr:class I SAM-dependent methyltransferase [Oscillospiraceae bacterium]
MRKLPNRLQCIAAFIDDEANVADIGTDHGLLPVYLTQTGKTRRLIASDISEGSLSAARRLAVKYGVTDKIEFIQADGLTALSPQDADIIVIAGVGGETIISILDKTPWVEDAVQNGSLKLILQPQTKLEVLCDYLKNYRYVIKEEKTVLDRGREYRILFI